MKNIFKTFISCMALSIAVTSCYDVIDDKADIDGQYEQASDVTASMSGASTPSFSEISASGSISGTEGVLEAGFMLSTSADFATYSSYKSEEVATSFTTTIGNLTEATTYYIRCYAYTVGGTKVSEVTTVTTPAVPVYDLNGTYTAVDYSTDDDSAGDAYEVTVEFVNGSTTDIKITNLWDGGKTIDAVYDPASGKISIPAQQLIFVHDKYGDVWMEDVNGTNSINGQFTAKGGFLNINAYNAVCGAGSFGGQYVKMNHK